MNVGILYFADEEYGLGHHYRCLVLAQELEKSGHTVYMLSNFQFRRKLYFQLRPHNQYDFYHIVDQCNLDWLVVDTPYVPDHFILEYAEKFNYKILYLNSDMDLSVVNINIIQGFLAGIYSGAKYVILRPELESHKSPIKNDAWFVFGGSADKMGLLSTFSKAMNTERAFLLGTELSKPLEKLHNDFHMFVTPNDDAAFIALMSTCKKACVSFGITAWELIYFNIPTYVFSPTKNHLRWAQAAEKEGLLKAYPDVGIPDEHKIIEFLNEPFEINQKSRSKLDLNAGKRVVELMENYENAKIN